MERLQYPTEILPNKNYTDKINLDLLIQEQNLYFHRRIDKPETDVFDHSPVLKRLVFREDAISCDDLPNLSVNLMGGKFEKYHFLYSQKGLGSKTWNKDNILNLEISEEHYKLHAPELTTHVFLLSEGIHNINIPYKREVTKDTRKIFESFALDQNEGMYLLTCKIFFAHDPVQLNYWHCELRFITEQINKVERDTNSSYRKDLFKKIYDEIIAKNVVHPNFLQEGILAINQSHYCSIAS